MQTVGLCAGLWMVMACDLGSTGTPQSDTSAFTTPQNRSPVVIAGGTQYVWVRWGQEVTVNLHGQVRDDGRPSGDLTTTWTTQHGPVSACFASAESDCAETTNDLVTQVALKIPGKYTFLLTADDGEFVNFSHTEVVVREVSAFADDVILLAESTRPITRLPFAVSELTGQLEVDFPEPTPAARVVGFRWELISGPGPVRFEDQGALNTEVSFRKAGLYRFRLIADGTDWLTSDTVVVEVQPELGDPKPPTVVAGQDRTLVLSSDGTASVRMDDSRIVFGAEGHESRIRWNRISGPAPIKFDDRESLNPTLRFSVPGRYELRLSAAVTIDDLRYDRSDLVVIHVHGKKSDNAPPIVFAGRTQKSQIDVKGNAEIELWDSMVADDGLNHPVKIGWRQLSGPTVVDFPMGPTGRFFATTNLPDGLTAPAVYELEIFANDGSGKEVSDQLTWIILP